MPFSPPTLNIGSALVENGLADDRFHVTDYIRDGAYPGHRAEKDEAEEYVPPWSMRWRAKTRPAWPLARPVSARDVSARRAPDRRR